MQYIAIFILALTPGIFWLWMAYRWDKYQPEPKWLVIRTFLLGMAVVIPVALIEWLLGFAGSNTANAANVPLSNLAYQAFIIAGLTEELAKFLVVYLSIYKNRHFDESTDGIVYASAAALGFASLENLFYMVSFGWSVIAMRSILSTVAHLLFAVLWGYPLALRKIGRKGATGLVILGLVGAMLAHGLYDFVLFTQSWAVFMIAPIMAGLITALVLMVRHSRRISTFRPKPAGLEIACPKCAGKIPANALFCPHCGTQIPIAVPAGIIACNKCGAVMEPGAAFCRHCGNRVG